MPLFEGDSADIISVAARNTKQSLPSSCQYRKTTISDALPFGRLWYGEPDAITNAIGYAKFRSRSHDAVIRVYDKAGNVIEAREHKGEFKVW